MTQTDASALLYVALLVLPLSALIARRLPIASVAKMALGWIAIFAVLLLAASQRDRLRPAWDRFASAIGDADQTVTGGTVRIAMADDGHFWAWASINGVRRRMLVDSGSTATALSADTAKAAGVATDESPFPAVLQTANGLVAARHATVRELTLGSIAARDLPVVVAPAFGDTDALGMNFLSRLKSWRVEGRTLVLEAKTGS